MYTPNIEGRLFPIHSLTKDGHCTCRLGPDCDKPAKHPNCYWKEWTKGKQTFAKSSNLGLRTGNGLVILDIDPRNGGKESYKKLKAALHDMPHTVCSLTPSGGFHIYFESVEPVRSQTNFMPGIDIKAEGGYVVFPPSVTPTGSYRWFDGAEINEIDIEVIPEDLLKMIKDRQPEIITDTSSGSQDVGELDYDKIKRALDGLPSDDYEIWYKTGMSLKSISNRGQEPWHLWDKWSSKSEKYDQIKTKKKWASFKANGAITYEHIFKLATDNGVDLNITEDLEDVVITLPTLEEKEPEPTVLDYPPAFAGEAVKIFQQSFDIPRNVAIAAAAQIIPSVMFQGHVMTPSFGVISSYSIFHGLAGSCKTRVSTILEKALIASGANIIPYAASGPALGKTLSQKANAAMYVDELGLDLYSWFKYGSKPSLKAQILKLWSGGSSLGQTALDATYSFQGYEDASFSLFGGVTPDIWSELVNMDSFQRGGMISRLEFIDIGPISQVDQDSEISYSTKCDYFQSTVMDRLIALRDHYGIMKERIKVKYDSPETRSKFNHIRNQVVVELNEAHSKKDFKRMTELNKKTRLAEIFLRTATRVAVMNTVLPADPKGQLITPVITQDIANWAESHVLKSFDISTEQSHGESVTADEAFLSEIINYCNENDGIISATAITKHRKLRKHHKSYVERNRCLQSFVDAERLTKHETKGKRGSKRTYYKLV